MRHFLVLPVLLASLIALASAFLPAGPDYSQYDPKKLEERYNIIQALVRPQPTYRPRIGAAYAKPAYRNAVTGYKNQAYMPYQPYRPASAPAYAPVKNVGYATGYINQAAPAPAAPYAFQGYNGIRFGGGRVHPIFNNDLLYKTNQVPKTNLGPYDSTAPIFIGGPTKATPGTALKSSFSSQPSFGFPKVSPQIDAYGNRPVAGNAYPYFG